MKRFFATLALVLMLGGLAAPVVANNSPTKAEQCRDCNNGGTSTPLGDVLPLL